MLENHIFFIKLQKGILTKQVCRRLPYSHAIGHPLPNRLLPSPFFLEILEVLKAIERLPW